MGSITKRAHPDPDRRTAVEQRVLAATTELLDAGASYTELGVQRIASAAGIARSTFYLYFKDKTELAIRLGGNLKQEIWDLGADWSPCPGGLSGLAEVFENIIRHYRPRAALLAAIAEVAGYDAEVQAAWNGSVDRFTLRMADRLREEQAAGRAPVDLDPVLAAQVLVWSGERVVAQQVAAGDPAQDALVARELASQHWYGTFRRPPGES